VYEQDAYFMYKMDALMYIRLRARRNVSISQSDLDKKTIALKKAEAELTHHLRPRT